jgi:tetratricopeptide (TPR) repeat protein
MDSGQESTAIADLESLVKEYPKDFSAQRFLAIAYSSMDRHADAQRVAEALILSNPSNAESYGAAAKAWDDAGEPARAEEYFRKAIPLAPRAPMLQHALGVVLAKQKKWKEGQAVFARASELEKDWAPAIKSSAYSAVMASQTVASRPVGLPVTGLIVPLAFTGQEWIAVASIESAFLARDEMHRIRAAKPALAIRLNHAPKSAGCASDTKDLQAAPEGAPMAVASWGKKVAHLQRRTFILCQDLAQGVLVAIIEHRVTQPPKPEEVRPLLEAISLAAEKQFGVKPR